jgi:hypothetical protein
VKKPKPLQQPVQPDQNEQSGSAGRNTQPDKLQQDKNTGQDLYGQSGGAGKRNPETAGQTAYRRSESNGGQESKAGTNKGSGRAEHDTEEYRNSKGDQSGGSQSN